MKSNAFVNGYMEGYLTKQAVDGTGTMLPVKSTENEGVIPKAERAQAGKDITAAQKAQPANDARLAAQKDKVLETDMANLRNNVPQYK